METLKTKPEESKAQQELGDETFMSAADLRAYMTEMQMARASSRSTAWTVPGRRARS